MLLESHKILKCRNLFQISVLKGLYLPLLLHTVYDVPIISDCSKAILGGPLIQGYRMVKVAFKGTSARSYKPAGILVIKVHCNCFI